MIVNAFLVVFIEENILYSYGKHYALAIRLDYEAMLKSGYSYVINSTFASQTTSTQASAVRQAVNDYIELPDADCSEQGLKTLLDTIHQEIIDLETRFKKFKNPQGVRALQTQDKISDKMQERGTIESLNNALHGGNAVKYIKSLDNLETNLSEECA